MRPTAPALLALLLCAATAALAAAPHRLHRLAPTIRLTGTPRLSTTVRTGLNGDVCKALADCAPPRLCVQARTALTSSQSACEAAGRGCLCVRPDWPRRRCATSGRCDVGERCMVRAEGDTSGLCYSCGAAGSLLGSAVATDGGNCAGEAVAAPAPDAGGGGLNGARCKATADCASPRECLDAASTTTSSPQACTPRARCICLRRDFIRRRCTGSARCDVGERCSRRPGVAAGLCYDCGALEMMEGLENVDDGNCEGELAATVAPPVSVPPPPAAGAESEGEGEDEGEGDGEGETESEGEGEGDGDGEEEAGDQAADQAADEGEGQDGEEPSSPGLPTSTDPVPTTVSDATAAADAATTATTDDSSSDDAATDDSATDDPATEDATEDDEAAAEAPETTTESETASSSPAPCVDAAALAHLPASSLVFARHKLADVLCDGNDSCASRGHVVVYDGAPMTMAGYCAAHGSCVARRMLVNSPGMRRGLRVASRTRGLEYTALAARYESEVEAALLRALVRLGM